LSLLFAATGVDFAQQGNKQNQYPILELKESKQIMKRRLPILKKLKSKQSVFARQFQESMVKKVSKTMEEKFKKKWHRWRKQLRKNDRLQAKQ
jgi:hypothetical protein